MVYVYRQVVWKFLLPSRVYGTDDIADAIRRREHNGRRKGVNGVMVTAASSLRLFNVMTLIGAVTDGGDVLCHLSRFARLAYLPAHHCAALRCTRRIS